MKQNNVLVNAKGRAVLSDFGLVGIIDVGGRGLITRTVGSGNKHLWAPELHEPADFGLDEFIRTPATDMYSYGSLCLQVSQVHGRICASS